MRGRFWVAYGALAVAFALLVPTLATLSGSMDSFANDLANGAFRPFGPTSNSALRAFSGSLGGFTGQSAGNYLPGAAEIPPSWVMDRDGRGGNVVIDAVFDPSLGAMKRLKAYDALAADGSTLGVQDPRLRPFATDAANVRYDTPIDGSFQVQFRAGQPTPIFSPHPRAAIRAFSTNPPVPGGVVFLQDGADTLYARTNVDITTMLNISFLTEARYYDLAIPDRASVDDYPLSVRPRLPEALVEDAQVVLARAGAGDGRNLGATLEALTAYFRSFTEGDIPPPSEVDSLYLALALGGHGCCRHRAFAFMVTTHALGIPSRVVVNEAHAFVELMVPDGSWRQVNLGGCGTYTVNNPNQYRELFSQARDPRNEANPDEDLPLPTVPTFTNITESPTRIVKGERYTVNGTVETPGGRPAPGIRLDVYLNETKDSPGRLTGAGVSDARGEFSILARVPRELAARNYQLVARAQDPGAGSVRYLESWSDPEVSVFAPTSLLIPRIVAAAGFPANVSGRLVDVDNNAVGGANVTWSVNGTSQPVIRTDAAGRFATRITFPEVGSYPIEIRFAGGQHHGATTASATVQVKRGALLLPGEAPTLARGETGELSGSIAVSGVPLAGREVRASVLASNNSTRVLASGTATTVAGGAFKIPMEIAARAIPGIYPVRYEVPALGLQEVGIVRLAIRPTLDVDVPSTLAPSEDWVIRASLASDDGSALPGGIVEVVIDGNRTSARALLTNATGVARFEFAGRGLTPGAHSITITFPGNELHAEAVKVSRIDIVRPWFATIPLWAYAAAIGAVTLVAVAAWLATPGGPLAAIFAAKARRPDRWRIEVHFPAHPPGVAPVFEAGETIDTVWRVRHRDGRSLGSRIVINGPDGRRRGRAAGDGGHATAFVAPSAGVLTLRARVTGLARLWTTPYAIEIPIGPYRRAVEAGFVALRERARLAGSASPSDLVRALGPGLARVQQQRLREAASLFEVADYSERPVDRAFYHSFALARRDLERALEARDA